MTKSKRGKKPNGDSMTPTKEQIEDAKKLCQEQGLHGALTCCCDDVASFLASRDSRIIAEARAGAFGEAARIAHPDRNMQGQITGPILEAKLECAELIAALLDGRAAVERAKMSEGK